MPNLKISDKLEIAVINVSEKVNTTFKRCLNWEHHDEHSLWYELVACILGSNVIFEQAQDATHFLETSGLLDIKNEFHNYENFEKKIANALSIPILHPLTLSGHKRKYRFPKLKANHIRRTAEAIYKPGKSIKQILLSCKNSHKARIRIISRAVGIGPKQASLFLRNIVYVDNLAILDVHILKYMFFLKLIPEVIKSIENLTTYEKIEKKLQAYAEKLKIKLSCLDTAIWVVMRVYRREFAI